MEITTYTISQTPVRAECNYEIGIKSEVGEGEKYPRRVREHRRVGD